MAIDTRALGAQAMAANQAYRARSGGYSPFAPAQPQQTLAPAQTQPPANPYGSMMPLPPPSAVGSYARQQAAQQGGVQSAPVGYTPGSGAGGLTPKSLLVGAGGVPMGQPVSQGIPAFGTGFGAATFGQGGPQGGSALTGGLPNGQMSAGAYGLPRLPSAPSSPSAPATNPVTTPVTSFTGGGDWARNFFGSAYGGPYGTGNAMARLNGFAQNNPEAVQRMRNTGLVPPADYYKR